MKQKAQIREQNKGKKFTITTKYLKLNFFTKRRRRRTELSKNCSFHRWSSYNRNTCDIKRRERTKLFNTIRWDRAK